MINNPFRTTCSHHLCHILRPETIAVNQMRTNASFHKSRRLDGRRGPFSHGCHAASAANGSVSRDINTHAQGGGRSASLFEDGAKLQRGNENGHISQALKPEARPWSQVTELMICAAIHDRFRLEPRRRWIEKTVLTPKT